MKPSLQRKILATPDVPSLGLLFSSVCISPHFNYVFIYISYIHLCVYEQDYESSNSSLSTSGGEVFVIIQELPCSRGIPGPLPQVGLFLLAALQSAQVLRSWGCFWACLPEQRADSLWCGLWNRLWDVLTHCHHLESLGSGPNAAGLKEAHREPPPAAALE